MGEAGMFGAELRRARLEAGLSLATLARRVHFSKGYLSKVENGLVPPNRALATLCDNELDTSGRLCALIPETSRRRPRASTEVPRSQLSGIPISAGHFTGRANEVAEICAVLVDSSAIGRPAATVCVIDGMAGIGKTALALRIAHRLEAHFEDCVFLDLQGYRHDTRPESAAGALERLLRLLGAAGEHIPVAVDDRAARYRKLLSGRRLLIVLDDAYSTEQVVSLLPAEPRCRVLITSRNRLIALDDAHHVSLSLLPAEDAVSLFRSIAGPRLADTEVDIGVGELLGRVVQLCGRLPLAVRIAAARYRAREAWTLAYLDGRLADERGRLAELDNGERSVAAAFQLSFQALPANQQRLFELLALSSGPDVDGNAAAALAGTERPDAEQLLERLLDVHLITQQAEGRYRFHDLLRAFAADRLFTDVPKAVRDAALDRLLNYYLYTADLADRLLTPHRYRLPLEVDRPPAAVPRLRDHDDALRWMTAELPNLVAACRAAAEHHRDPKCWQLAFTLRGLCFLTKAWDAWTVTHEVALDAAIRAGDRRAEATTLNNLGLALVECGDFDAASVNYQRAFALFQELGDRHGATNSLANDAWVHHYRGDHQRALRDLQSAYRSYARTGSRRNAAISLRGIGLFKAELGELTEAVRDIEAALRVFNELGLDLDATMALNCLGVTWHRLGQGERATALYRQAVVLGRACGSRFEEARAEAGLGAIAAEARERGAARRHWERALELFDVLGAPHAAEIKARLDAPDVEAGSS